MRKHVNMTNMIGALSVSVFIGVCHLGLSSTCFQGLVV